MDVTRYLELMVEKNASDLFFCTGTQAHLKIEGTIRPIGKERLAPGEVEELAMDMMRANQKTEFIETLECNFALSLKDIGRFRVNVFRQRGEVSIVIRYIKSDIPQLAQMNLPEVLEKVSLEKRGLILCVGGTGSGKSTTMAAMIGYRNRNEASHILTIEDPIEFIHQHDKSIVQQREVGIDTLSYDNALKNALRETPDVIYIGEIRDQLTMKAALNYAETGHLCLATLHANNANQALSRIVNFFPETYHSQLYSDLSLNLRTIISQRLIKSVNNAKQQIPAVEILHNTPFISELILRGEIGAIKEALKESTEEGAITFDQALLALLIRGKITQEEAIKNADSANDLGLAIRMGLDADDSDVELIMG